MISVCIIAKNEESNLAKCLESIKKYNFEVIVVDTGSVDETKKIALKYTNNVYDYVWNENFSEARNYSISKAKNDIIMILDADEEITELDICKLEQIIIKEHKSIGRINIINVYERNGQKFKYNEKVTRIFNKKFYTYKGRIHEQLMKINNLETKIYDAPVIINHIGYSNTEIERTNKITRNIKLLLEELKRESKEPYLYYQLGKSYYMKNNYQKAVNSLKKAIDLLVNKNSYYVEDLIETYGYSLINSNQYSEAMKLLNLYDEYSNSADFIFLAALILMNNGYINEAILEFKKATKLKKCKMDGVNSYLALYNIGVIYECIGDYYSAIEFYKLCNEYNLSNERINVIQNNNLNK